MPEKSKMTNNIVNRVLIRLGHPVVTVYTPTETILEFIDEAVDKMKPYCAHGNRKTGLFQVVNGLCTVPFNTRDIIDVYPKLPSEENLIYGDLFNGLNNPDKNFSWTYNDSGSIYCKTLRNSVFIVYTEYKKFSIEDLSDFYRGLAFRWVLALTKESEASIRGKFEFGNSPFTTNASDLRSEANDEKSQVEDILSQQPLLKAATVQQF